MDVEASAGQEVGGGGRAQHVKFLKYLALTLGSKFANTVVRYMIL